MNTFYRLQTFEKLYIHHGYIILTELNINFFYDLPIQMCFIAVLYS